MRAFPEAARRDAGFQLDRLQRGRDPNDWKPMASITPGVREVRIRDQAGAFRVVYVAKYEDAIYVLHAFQKKTQRTATQNVLVARQRYHLIEELQVR